MCWIMNLVERQLMGTEVAADHWIMEQGQAALDRGPYRRRFPIGAILLRPGNHRNGRMGLAVEMGIGEHFLEHAIHAELRIIDEV